MNKANKKETKTIFNKKTTQQIPKKKIIAVTKNFPIETVKSAIKNNIFKIGENKVQEAEKKFKLFEDRKKIELHLIGDLQTNKVKKAVLLFDVIETVWRTKTIEKINKEAGKINKKQKIYLQINISKDPQKKGVLEKEIKTKCEEIKEKKNIKLCGVMTILKKGLDKKEIKNFYEKTKKQQRIIKKTIKTCTQTSMGMSGDYKIALSAGATEIRLGTALFGKRQQ